MKKLILAIAILNSVLTFSQSFPFNISGKIQTDTDKKAVESATVYLERIKDSSVVSYTISDEKGEFSLKGKSFYKDLKLYISFVGMKKFSKNLELSETVDHELGIINLKEDNHRLNEVIVRSSTPVYIKKDTLEFNVKSFNTKKNATVEDVLRKLPGVEVDAEGKITVNGKPVNRILVNGKSFFGSDPTITTKNLSKEIIEKIQVTDTKTKSEAFSGEKGDDHNKTINLKINKENNKGWFGRISAAAGTDKRFEAATMINRFDNDQRMSVLANANNINATGFSFGEISNRFGRGSNTRI